MNAEAKNLYVLLTAQATNYRSTLREAARETDAFGRDVDKTGRKVERVGKEIDSMSGRVRLLVDSLALVGPALAPLGGVGLAGVAGLANQVALAAAGAGSAALAFIGMGDALEALDKAQIEPTADHLADLRRELSDLQPDARRFLLDLFESRERLMQVQRASAAGFFPGADRGLQQILSIVEPLSSLVFELSDVTGDTVDRLAGDLSSDRALEFFDFLKAEARPILSDLYGTVANLTGGLVELWEAFTPLNRDFSDWLLDNARDFDRWASGLDKTEGFQDFLAYVRETGPQVAETASAIGNAMVAVVTAVAPLGGPSLEGIELVADLLRTIADTPAGPAIMSFWAATTLLNRSLMVTAALMRKAGFDVDARGGGFFGQLEAKGKAARTSVRALGRDLRDMATISMTAGARSTREIERYNAALDRTRRTVRRVASGVTTGLATGLLATGASESMGNTNTLLGGLIGAGIGRGPWGAAIGVVVGGLADVYASAHRAEDAITAYNRAIENASSVSAFQVAQQRLSDDLDSFASQVSSDDFAVHLFKSITSPATIANNLDVLFGGFESSQMGRMEAAEQAAKLQAGDVKFAAEELALAMGLVDERGVATIEDLDAALQKAAPAMHDLGISTEDLGKAAADGSILDLVEQIGDYQAYADSAKGRTEQFAESVADLANDALATAESADQLSQALEALLSPTLQAEEATDQWRASLKAMRGDLDAGAGFKGMSDAAMENRELTRQAVEDSMARLEALAQKSTTTERDMARAVAETRREFIESGIAAGFSREEIVKRANALGLTPSLVKTVFEAVGITKFDLQVRSARKALKDLPPEVRTEIKQHGGELTKKQVDELVEKYKLTEKQRQALLTVRDLASDDVRAVLKALKKLDETRANPTVTVEDHATFKLRGIKSLLDGLHDKSISVTTYQAVVHRPAGDVRVQPGGKKQESLGGIVRFYAGGGMDRRNQHVAQILPAGTWRIWAEDETGGEAYIPLANDHRRPRARQILSQTASMFGGRVEWGRGRRFDHQPRGQSYGGGHVTVHAEAKLPSKLQLVVDGRSFTAYVRGHADNVFTERMDTTARAAGSNRRMDWT